MGYRVYAAQKLVDVGDLVQVPLTELDHLESVETQQVGAVGGQVCTYNYSLIATRFIKRAWVRTRLVCT